VSGDGRNTPSTVPPIPNHTSPAPSRTRHAILDQDLALSWNPTTADSVVHVRPYHASRSVLSRMYSRSFSLPRYIFPPPSHSHFLSCCSRPPRSHHYSVKVSTQPVYASPSTSQGPHRSQYSPPTSSSSQKKGIFFSSIAGPGPRRGAFGLPFRMCDNACGGACA